MIGTQPQHLRVWEVDSQECQAKLPRNLRTGSRHQTEARVQWVRRDPPDPKPEGPKPRMGGPLQPQAPVV